MSTQSWTYAKYAALPEDGRRFEVIEGSLVEMTAPTLLHQIVSAAFFSAIQRLLVDTRLRVLFAPVDVVLGHGELGGCETVVQPDLLVISKGPQGPCHHGPPLFVLEVLSPSTRRHDEVVKLALYEKHGVGEVWLVDAEGRTVNLFRRDGAVFLPGECCACDQQREIKSLGVYVNLCDVAAALETL